MIYICYTYIYVRRLLHNAPISVRYIVYRVSVCIYAFGIECPCVVYIIYSYIRDTLNIFLYVYPYLLVPPIRSIVTRCRILLLLYLAILSALIYTIIFIRGEVRVLSKKLSNYDFQLLCDEVVRWCGQCCHGGSYIIMYIFVLLIFPITIFIWDEWWVINLRELNDSKFNKIRLWSYNWISALLKVFSIFIFFREYISIIISTCDMFDFDGFAFVYFANWLFSHW